MSRQVIINKFTTAFTVHMPMRYDKTHLSTKNLSENEVMKNSEDFLDLILLNNRMMVYSLLRYNDLSRQS